MKKSNRRSEVNHNHRIRSYMKKKYKIFFGTLILLTIYTYFHCNTYITQRQWKQTSDNGIIGGGIISFGDDSSFSYHWPIIEKDNKNIGVVLLCVGERMVVYSLQDNSIGFYMYIWIRRKKMVQVINPISCKNLFLSLGSLLEMLYLCNQIELYDARE